VEGMIRLLKCRLGF